MVKINSTVGKRRTKKRKNLHKLYPPITGMSTLSVVRTDEGPSSKKLDQYRGLNARSQQTEVRKLDDQSRLKLIADMERELDADLSAIRPVPRDHWNPIRLATASGLSISQVTRVFHSDPNQQRWRAFASDLRGQADGCGIPASKRPAEIQARIMALVPGHRYAQQSQGILRLARAMGISVDELVGIILDSE